MRIYSRIRIIEKAPVTAGAFGTARRLRPLKVSHDTLRLTDNRAVLVLLGRIRIFIQPCG